MSYLKTFGRFCGLLSDDCGSQSSCHRSWSVCAALHSAPGLWPLSIPVLLSPILPRHARPALRRSAGYPCPGNRRLRARSAPRRPRRTPDRATAPRPRARARRRRRGRPGRRAARPGTAASAASATARSCSPASCGAKLLVQVEDLTVARGREGHATVQRVRVRAVDEDEVGLLDIAQVGLNHRRPPVGVDPSDERARRLVLAGLEPRRAAPTGRDRGLDDERPGRCVGAPHPARRSRSGRPARRPPPDPSGSAACRCSTRARAAG